MEVLFANDPRAVLPYAKNVLACDIHTRARDQAPAEGRRGRGRLHPGRHHDHPGSAGGCNEKYGLLGSNKATEETVKLFPRDPQPLVDAIRPNAGEDRQACGGHGLRRRRVQGPGWARSGSWPIRWSPPAYTPGLEGTPNELKLKVPG